MKAHWRYAVYRDEHGDEVIEIFGAAMLHADYVVRAGIKR